MCGLSSSLDEGPPCERKRWRQVDQSPNAAPACVDVVVPQPQACNIYYSGCGRIDQHNRLRQASLQLEKKIKTLLWDRRVNMSIFLMCVVDSYLLMTGCRGTTNNGFSTSKEFFMMLSEQLIENKYDESALRKRASRGAMGNNGLAHDDGDRAIPPHLHLISLTPTKKKKKGGTGNVSFQGRCMVCSIHTRYVCRECQRFQPDISLHQYHVCDKNEKACMSQHILDKHPHAIREVDDCNYQGGTIELL